MSRPLGRAGLSPKRDFPIATRFPFPVPVSGWTSRTDDIVGAWIDFRIPDYATGTSIELTAGFTRATGSADIFSGNQPRLSRTRLPRRRGPRCLSARHIFASPAIAARHRPRRSLQNRHRRGRTWRAGRLARSLYLGAAGHAHRDERPQAFPKLFPLDCGARAPVSSPFAVVAFSSCSRSAPSPCRFLPAPSRAGATDAPS